MTGHSQIVVGTEINTADDGGVAYLVVVGTLSATLLAKGQHDGNMEPWVETFGKDEDGQDFITISNNCGFGQYVYRGSTLEQYKAWGSMPTSRDADEVTRITVLGRVGEWCQLSTHLYEFDTLLKVRYWADQAYVLDWAELYAERSGNWYVFDRSFIDRNNLGDFAKSIPEPQKMDSCWDEEELRSAGRWPVDAQDLARFGERYCSTEAVYIVDIPDQRDHD